MSVADATEYDWKHRFSAGNATLTPPLSRQRERETWPNAIALAKRRDGIGRSIPLWLGLSCPTELPMSYSHLEIEDEDARTPFLPQLGRYARLAIWSVINAALLFGEQLAELLAPLLLLGGIVWWAVPRVLAAITLDGPPGDLLQMVRSRVPHDIYLNGDYYSAGTLISDGLWMIALVAVCRTASTALTTLLLDRR